MAFIAIMEARIGLPPLFLPFHRKAKIISVFQIGTLSCLENRPVNIILNGIDFGIEAFFPSEIRNSDFLSSAAFLLARLPHILHLAFLSKNKESAKNKKRKSVPNASRSHSFECATCKQERVESSPPAKSMPRVSG